MQILNWNHVLLVGVLHASYGVWSRYVSNIRPVVKHHLILYNSIKSLLSLIVQNADFPAGTGFLLIVGRGIRALGDLFGDNVSKGTILWIFES